MIARKDWIRYCKALRNRCGCCGKRFTARACGPTHAAIAAARACRMTGRR